MDRSKPFIVPGKLEFLQAIANYVKQRSSEAGLSRIAAHNLRLAVDEIATNIICYGYRDAGGDNVLKLYSHMDEHTLTLWLEDNAAPYDPTATPEPEGLNRPIEERPVGGLGMYLAVQSVDHLYYEQIETFNRTVFVMNRPATES